MHGGGEAGIDSGAELSAAAEGELLDRGAGHLRDRIGSVPETLVILGSGLGGMTERLSDPVRVPFQEFDGLPPIGVQGHAGAFVAGSLGGRPVLVQAGRHHLYEGYAPHLVVRTLRFAVRAGVRTLVVTNAAGGLDRRLPAGSLLLLDDLLNFQFRSPLAGPVLPGEERFPDMSAPFDPELQERALEAARNLRIPLSRGTYAAVLGPSYETPAEVRMLAALGAHAVGMSTLAEVVVARASGVRVLGFSIITNPGAGLSPTPLDHAEVLEVGRAAGAGLARLLEELLPRITPDRPRITPDRGEPRSGD